MFYFTNIYFSTYNIFVCQLYNIFGPDEFAILEKDKEINKKLEEL